MSFEIADADETPSAPKFNFEEPPTVPQPPKVPKPNAPSDPTSDPNAFSGVPIPSAVAPAQPEQQIEGTSKESDKSFGGLFDLEKTSTKLQAVPEAPVQKAKVSNTALCHFFVLRKACVWCLFGHTWQAGVGMMNKRLVACHTLQTVSVPSCLRWGLARSTFYSCCVSCWMQSRLHTGCVLLQQPSRRMTQCSFCAKCFKQYVINSD